MASQKSLLNTLRGFSEISTEPEPEQQETQTEGGQQHPNTGASNNTPASSQTQSPSSTANSHQGLPH